MNIYPEFKKKTGNILAGFPAQFTSGSDEYNFEYYLESSAVYSSNIEGNSIDLNSFMNSKMLKKKIISKEYKEINDLILAYKFAKKNNLTGRKLLKANEILSKQILIRSKRGQLREERTGVFDPAGLVYLAIKPEKVKAEIKKLFDDIKYLKQRNLSVKEIFYYALFIHLMFIYICLWAETEEQPRLLEKWFLSAKPGESAWKVSSEKYCFENRSRYYRNINPGQNYYELNYKNCLPF